MLIFLDKRAPALAKAKLNKIGEVVDFSTEGLVYGAISGHPDIFITQFDSFVITAPNLPAKYKTILTKQNIKFTEGESAVGNKYPQTARYNAVPSPGYFIHNLNISDAKLLEVAEKKTKINISQGYARCNLLPLTDNKMITSDRGIFRTLKKYGIDVFFVNPKRILLPGFSNGFIGGACGISGDKVYVLGRFSYLSEGESLGLFIRSAGLEIVELYDGPLFDGGGIFFIK